MRHLITAVTAACLVASVAYAQAPMVAAPGSPQNAAVKPMNQNNSSTPVPGANSFTHDEAVKQIEAKGYTGVKGLTKDQDGVWRGTATMNGKSGPISVDYQGNVN